MDKIAEESLEFVRKRVTALGMFSREAMRLSRVEALEYESDRLAYKLETELLCQSRGNQRQTVQFWVPMSWWQHLKHAIGRRVFGIFMDFERAPWHFGPNLQGTWLKRWLGRWIKVTWRSVNKTVEWKVLDSYPKANIEVPSDFGAPVRIVIMQGEVDMRLGRSVVNGQ